MSHPRLNLQIYLVTSGIVTDAVCAFAMPCFFVSKPLFLMDYVGIGLNLLFIYVILHRFLHLPKNA